MQKGCKSHKRLIYTLISRRDRDSNPGNLAVQRFSRPPQSTTLPPLQYVLLSFSLDCGAKVVIIFLYPNIKDAFFFLG